MVRILHYIPGFGYGGIETVVLNLCKNVDKKYHFDFLVETEIPDYAKKIIEEKNGRVIQIPKMTQIKEIGIYFKRLYEIFKKGNYDVFHCHSLDTRPFPMIFANMFRVKCRIMHIHFNDFNNKKNLFIKKFFLHLGQKNATSYVACSKRSADNILTKKNREKAIILNNGISIKKFQYDEKIRKQIRKNLKIDEKTILVGCIGRLSYLKNQKFVIEITQKLPSNYHVIFLGDGEDKDELKNLVKEKKIKNIVFVGNVGNVKEYIDACDLVLMPSLSEGMPLTLIELQANGVSAIVSTAIDEEFIVNSNVIRLNLDINDWLENIKLIKPERVKPEKLLMGYDIKNVAQLYEKIILNNLNSEK